ncbi:hypothetical protein NQ318_008494 [Aromia moschata]|uniref:CCHC-type domain-containing protein n=1 Tax=Aromia moschata TaxID=1265417 RepID=A0AAV8XC45_9CUCU|nr:hypothetical protein NQ318_008494 [Aromia moschata]
MAFLQSAVSDRDVAASQMDPKVFYGNKKYIHEIPSDNESDDPELSDDEDGGLRRVLVPESDDETGQEVESDDDIIIPETDIDSDDADDIPLSELAEKLYPGEQNMPKEVTDSETPSEFFAYLFTKDMVAEIAAQTNLYCSQKRVDRSANISENEIEQFIVEEIIAVDEQIIPTKSRLTIKQYNAKKPHKWGYKVFVLSGISGFNYNFYIFDGSQSNEILEGAPDFGSKDTRVEDLIAAGVKDNRTPINRGDLEDYLSLQDGANDLDLGPSELNICILSPVITEVYFLEPAPSPLSTSSQADQDQRTVGTGRMVSQISAEYLAPNVGPIRKKRRKATGTVEETRHALTMARRLEAGGDSVKYPQYPYTIEEDMKAVEEKLAELEKLIATFNDSSTSNLFYTYQSKLSHRFLERVEELRMARHVSKETLFESGIDLFSGRAYQFYVAYRNQVSTWDELVALLKEEFLSPTTTKNYAKLKILMKNIAPFYQTQLALTEVTSIAQLRELGRRLEVRKEAVECYVAPSRRTSSLEPDLAYVQATNGDVDNGRATTCGQPMSEKNNNKVIVCYRCNKPGHRVIGCTERRGKCRWTHLGDRDRRVEDCTSINKLQAVLDYVLEHAVNDERPYLKVDILGKYVLGHYGGVFLEPAPSPLSTSSQADQDQRTVGTGRLGG